LVERVERLDDALIELDEAKTVIEEAETFLG